MGNCWYRESSDYIVSSNAKPEQNQVAVKKRYEHDDSKLPSNPKEVEDLRRDSAANHLIAFTYDELKIITGHFRPDRVLGGGGFGSVYKGFISEELREGLPSIPVAVKVHDGDNSHQGHREWLAEVIFLGECSHPNLVKLIGYCCENEHRVLVYEYMARGSVENNLFSKILLPLPWSIRMKIAFGAAKGLAFLHEAEKPVIYRDFKTSNILLDLDYNAKLSDFGLAKDGPVGDKSHVSTRIMGTYGYAAPEYIMTGHLTPRSDVYSFGVVLLELLTGRKSLDKLRPAREQNLTEWALPLLKEKKKVLNIIDPRLEASSDVGSEAPKEGEEEEPYEEYEVEIDQPYGIKFVKGRDGGTYIDAIAPGGSADKAGVFTVGDKVLATSAVFGTEIWPAAEYGRTMYTIRQRIGPLLMRMQKRYGKIETGGEFTDKEIIRAERNSGVVSSKLREIQMQNYLKKKELKERRETDLREGLRLYKNAKYEEALEKFESVLGTKPEPDEAAVASYNVACCYSKLNQIQAALSTLEEALNSGFEDFKRIRTDPDLANARASPEFDPLLKRFDESFINENAINAIKSIFGIFNKK